MKSMKLMKHLDCLNRRFIRYDLEEHKLHVVVVKYAEHTASQAAFNRRVFPVHAASTHGFINITSPVVYYYEIDDICLVW